MANRKEKWIKFITLPLVFAYFSLILMFFWHHHPIQQDLSGVSYHPLSEQTDAWLMNDGTCIFSFSGVFNNWNNSQSAEIKYKKSPVIFSHASPRDSKFKNFLITTFPYRGPPQVI